MQKTFLIISAILLFSISSCTEDVPEVNEPDSVLAVANAIDGTKIFPIVEQLTAFHLADSAISYENFPPGELFPSDHLTRSSAVGYIAYSFREIGYNAEVLQLGDEPLVAYNVVAEYPGTTHPEEVVLVAAHLDAFYGGADDNSSSIAALLEISRAVKDFSFARTIRFVAFDLEEFGSIGSTRYIMEGHADDVKSAVVMDMIGYSSEEPGSQKNVKGLRVPDVGDFIFVVGNQKSAELTQKVVSLSNSAQLAKTLGIITPNDGAYFLSSVFMRSDHGLLWYRGIPAIFFTDGGNFRNPHYHEPSDLPETLNKDFLIANTKANSSNSSHFSGGKTMKKLIFVTIFMMATGHAFSQSTWKIAPYLQQTGIIFASDRLSSLGYGSGLGLSLTKSHFIVQTDMNLYWMNGNAVSNRLAAGFRKDGLWSPTLLGTISLIWGSRTEILSETGQRPPSATWAAGLRLAPFRFENDKGYLSVAEIGYGLGPDNAKSLEISLVTIGINF